MADLLDVLKKFRTDPEKETDGVWEEIELAPGVFFEVKIASTENKAYRNRILEAFANKGIPEEMSDVDADRTMAQHMAGTLLTDWKLNYNGVDVPFSEEVAVELLTSMRSFQDRVMRLARDRTRFSDDKIEEVAARLGNFCTGGSSTEVFSPKKPSKSESKKATTRKAGTGG